MTGISYATGKDTWTTIKDITTGTKKTGDFVALLYNHTMLIQMEASTYMALLTHLKVALNGLKAIAMADCFTHTLAELLTLRAPVLMMWPDDWSCSFTLVFKAAHKDSLDHHRLHVEFPTPFSYISTP